MRTRKEPTHPPKSSPRHQDSDVQPETAQLTDDEQQAASRENAQREQDTKDVQRMQQEASAFGLKVS